MEVAAQSSPVNAPEQSSAVNNPRQILRIPKPKPKAAINDVGWNHIDRTKPEPLDKRFADVKSSLIKPENYVVVQASWERLTKALQERVSEIESSGSSVIDNSFGFRFLLIYDRLYQVLISRKLAPMVAFRKMLRKKLKRLVVVL